MRVLVMSPHPDDDVISMGGTLAQLCQQGYEVASLPCPSPLCNLNLLQLLLLMHLEGAHGTTDTTEAVL